MNDIRFFDKAHWTEFTKVIARMKHSDVYHTSLAYLLTVDTVTRDHIDDCFDFDKDGIKLDALNKPWQTGTSKKTTRLAFNLWKNDYMKQQLLITRLNLIGIQHNKN